MKFLTIVLSIFVLSTSFDVITSQIYSGDLTYYTEWKTHPGSCNNPRARYNHYYVAALSMSSFMRLPQGTTNPNEHPLCASKQCIRVNGARGSVILKISDSCEACKPYDVDVADTVFPMLDDPAKGRVPITWQFVNCFG